MRHGQGFWVGKHGRAGMGLKLLTLHFNQLLSCVKPSQPVSLIDIGAGIHNLAPEYAYSTSTLHPDDSDALWLLHVFKDRATVHAFEINSASVKQLQRAAKERNMTRALSRNLRVHHMGVGGNSSRGWVGQCGLANTYKLQDSNHHPCVQGEHVKITSMDAFALHHLGHAPLYVKVDCEGGEFDVLEGMSSLLQAGHIELMSFEYANGWDPAFDSRRPLTPVQRSQVKNTLHRFVTRLSEWGYDSYLINAPSWNRVTLVPVYERFWQDGWEICFNRSLFYYGHCWNDLLVMRRCSCVKQVIFNKIIPLSSVKRGAPIMQTNRFPECHCL